MYNCEKIEINIKIIFMNIIKEEAYQKNQYLIEQNKVKISFQRTQITI